MAHGRHRTRRLALGALPFAALVGLLTPSNAWAEPPAALPASAPDGDNQWQPALDFDTDGCYSTPAIGPDGTLNPGLNLGGDVNGNCRDRSDLENTNVYSRSKCNNGWCAYMYGYYFEKDQAAHGPGSAGHKHDWEHIIVWVQDGHTRYVSASQHSSYETKPEGELQFDGGSHAKIVYHKDGVSTHCFRFAKPNGGDEPPENHEGRWQVKGLVGWDNYPGGIRDKLVAADFGAATLKLTDERFGDELAKAKPSDVPLDPHG
ncbi:necrosis inducing protein (NPP1) [Herbihabitans rhizosphaerae]|uniref:Necrosis inducing protein (NPP1) n=1 Tax=Herbihabitans rhizosphaerae TaxID=1872711 RepID=A0A4Q7KGZ2_9PSEU|nr:NPP1 family protein [Herbihabitans rhizosphaerae]RZS34399.1 necrosis inducing protein (NPP1) [Herbihabitans rhizosphaerae]